MRIGTDRANQRGVNIEMVREYEHPDYNVRNDDNDIALVKLSEPAGRGMPLVRINPDGDVPFVGEWAHVMGWGDQDPEEDITRLASNLVGPRCQSIIQRDLTNSVHLFRASFQMGVDIQVISNSDCERASKGEDTYKGWIYDSMLCTMTQGQDACQG